MEQNNNTAQHESEELKKLTKDERTFCKLYMLGEAPYGGNAAKCYTDVFSYSGRMANAKAKKLLNEPHIKEYVESLKETSLEDAADVKRYLTRHLMRIIDECSEGKYTDRFGSPLSPAGIRSVAVNASRILMEMYPVKAAQVSKLNISGGEEGNNAPSVTFNVIVPGAQSTEVDIKENKENKGGRK